MTADTASVPVPPDAEKGGSGVPRGIEVAANWTWRLLLIGFGICVLGAVLMKFAVVTLPLAVALLLAALVFPFVERLSRAGVPRVLAAIIGVVLTLGAVGGMLTFAGQQVANGSSDLADQVVEGLDKIRDWFKTGPLGLTDSQMDSWIKSAQDGIAEWSKSGALEQATGIGTAIGHVAAGFFIVLFSMYFFLADGRSIWRWLVRFAPRGVREHVDSSGKVAWLSLTQFVRATTLVALADACGVMLVAWLLGIPFVPAIGVLVFLGAYVPMIGATVAGGVAVLVALVDQGMVTALLMLLGVIVVQQIEGHVLQPFLMGRFVAVHPLGIILAIAMGALVAGIGGVLVAVPLVAAINAVVLHLSDRMSGEEITRTEAEQRELDAAAAEVGEGEDAPVEQDAEPADD
ncbi:AI-2E family transporter [Nocardioides yefusunii]|uniref:AI-2E family transporter n=1 Tax=Nocardioides yefusunii TaxID=2500546 RepID=A0ABW1QUI3_9ACTN|nr:AI-2E family transporter [Nocardioides yefusunii]